MSDVTFTAPSPVISRLEELEHDLALRQGVFEEAARRWFIVKREKEKQRAEAFIRAEGSVAERNAEADVRTATIGVQEEAEWEALKAVIRTIEARASIGQSILRAQSR